MTEPNDTHRTKTYEFAAVLKEFGEHDHGQDVITVTINSSGEDWTIVAVPSDDLLDIKLGDRIIVTATRRGERGLFGTALFDMTSFRVRRDKDQRA